ncbi:MAG TPA: ABC transporter ATP-binding protein [Dongiaceae bacterium]|nr:ABC transporter ATP-binding protein [Dongiaceae bacterium]
MKAGSTAAPLLRVCNLAISALGLAITTGTDLEIGRGETVAIVGESGSGKSLTAKAIARLLPPGVSATGTILYDGIDLMSLPERDMRQVRGRRLSMMLQDPFTMLNPLIKSGRHIAEVLSERPEFRGGAALKTEVARRLGEVGITDPDVAERMPFQLSGGMSQRVALAAALASDPELLIADEPSTALDVTTQAEIIKLLKRVQQARGMSLILITHNLRLAFSTCDRIYVLYAGSLLEMGSARAVEEDPFHPYTLGLLLSEPPVDKRVPKLIAIRGKVPHADAVMGRCSFADRCDWVKDACRAATTPLAELAPGRLTACIRRTEIASEMRALRGAVLDHAAPPAVPEPATRPIVRAAAVVKDFAGRQGRMVQALKGVTIEVAPGESVGLVGESGSGKTTLGRTLVGLETPTRGKIEVAGIDASDFAAMSNNDRAATRRTIQMVFQDPYSTLNPRHSVRRSLSEAIGTIGRFSASEIDARVAELLREVGLPEYYAGRRPSSLSGGERQRVAIARALSVKPKVLVCDEPVSALDVSVQAQILNLFKRLQTELGLSYLFITHDLAVVRQVAERIYVLYLGEIVEHGPVETVISRPQHAYTRRLIESIPR